MTTGSQDTAAASPTSIRLAFTILGAAFTLLVIRAGLRLKGMRAGLQWIARVQPSRRVTSRDVADVCQSTVHAVTVATMLLPIRARCLERSLSIALLLRRKGVDAVVRIGIQALPFVAHAWVEVDGRPINENPALLRSFAVLERFE